MYQAPGGAWVVPHFDNIILCEYRHGGVWVVPPDEGGDETYPATDKNVYKAPGGAWFPIISTLEYYVYIIIYPIYTSTLYLYTLGSGNSSHFFLIFFSFPERFTRSCETFYRRVVLRTENLTFCQKSAVDGLFPDYVTLMVVEARTPLQWVPWV